MDGWMDVWMDGWMNERMNEIVLEFDNGFVIINLLHAFLFLFVCLQLCQLSW